MAKGANVAGEVARHTFLWLGRRRQERIRTLEALVELDGFAQSLYGPLADAAVRRAGLPNELKEWGRLSSRVVGRALSDPDDLLRSHASDLRDLIKSFGEVLHDPYSAVVASGFSQPKPGEPIRDMMLRLEYLLLPRWRLLARRRLRKYWDKRKEE